MLSSVSSAARECCTCFNGVKISVWGPRGDAYKCSRVISTKYSLLWSQRRQHHRPPALEAFREAALLPGFARKPRSLRCNHRSDLTCNVLDQVAEPEACSNQREHGKIGDCRRYKYGSTREGDAEEAENARASGVGDKAFDDVTDIKNEDFINVC